MAVSHYYFINIHAILWSTLLQTSPTSAALYISVLSGISTLLFVYGIFVIYGATVCYMKHRKFTMKFFALQIPVVLFNIQTHVFGVMARYDVPPCLHSRGSKVRAASKLKFSRPFRILYSRQ